MKIIVSCSGKFHAFSLVEELQKNGIDVVFFTSYSSIVNSVMRNFTGRLDREIINPRTIRTNLFIAVALKIFSKKPQFINNLFDFWVSRKIHKMNADYAQLQGHERCSQ